MTLIQIGQSVAYIKCKWNVFILDLVTLDKAIQVASCERQII